MFFLCSTRSMLQTLDDEGPVQIDVDAMEENFIRWPQQADDTPVSLALMVQTQRMEYDLNDKDLKLEEKTKGTRSSLKERDDFQDWVDSDDEEIVLNSSDIQKKTVLISENSETSFENKSPSSQNSVGQGSRKTGLGHKGGQTEEDLKDLLYDSGCSGSMTGDKDKLSDFKEFKGGYVAFGNDSKGGRISGKGTIKTSCLDFEKVSYVEELKVKFVDEDLVILRAPRKNDVYSLDLKNIIPSGGVTCLVAKATKDEAVLWHRRLGHVNFKNINKLVKGNLVRGLPSKTFKLDHSCLACRKGKQHRASCKKIEERTVREPLELLHMDLFGPVFSRDFYESVN
ncbi:putative ribonuclease H-like domain-containing protein [Tanacetum coccineum]|uniref:Ribonuclease H-like domain-containing protein n=1 Tax=Tanacetum coccineum TaxID=301880 RepID=A0ABQ5DBJ5_9ASTR